MTVPFRPFLLHISDGRTLSVQARDFIMISPVGTIIDLFQPDGDHDIVATGAITGITLIEGEKKYLDSTNALPA